MICRAFFRSDMTLATDTRQILESAKSATDLMQLFFGVVCPQAISKSDIFSMYQVGVVAMILCFFILWMSFIANVRENAWEFGILRALGLNVWSYLIYLLC